MRRHGNFAGSPAGGYGSQQMQSSHSDFQGQFEAFTPERDQPPHSDSQADVQWRWERDGENLSRTKETAIYNEGQGGVDPSRSYYHGQMNPKPGIEKQGSDHHRTQTQQHQENTKPVYENTRAGMQQQTFEGLEQKFMDDVTRLAKEQTDAEDAEILRHREKINTINARYEEQLAALRARHTGKREEIMRKESQARQQQYKKQAVPMIDQYHPNVVGLPSGHPQGYIGNAQDPVAVADAPSRSYGSDRFEAYGDRSRFQGGTRDHGFESRGQYTGGTGYDTGSRFY
ncbi:unnamed protein product [Cochlearia groenlandica]